MSRTPLMSRVRRLLREAHRANHAELPASVPPTVPISRRRFLGAAAMAGGGALLAGSLSSCRSLGLGGRAGSTRVAIVGGGLAGLTAAWHLTRFGHTVRVFDSSNRIGGRVFTVPGAFVEGVPCEFGGEFIDSDHADMHALVRELDLELVDVRGGEERNLIADAWFLGGRHYTDAQVLDGFRPLAARLAADAAALGDPIDFEHPDAAREIDRLSVAEYLGRIGASGWLATLLNVAYTTEYGLDSGEQSALNLLTLLAPEEGEEPGPGFEPYGSSDERFKVRGGNHTVARRLQERIGDVVEFEHRLVRLASEASGHRLTFERSGGGSREFVAEWVILALPFTMLRRVKLEADLHPVQAEAIRSLGYGTNSKVLAEFDEPVWRAQGMAGNACTDLPFQTGWDNSRAHPRRGGDPTAGYTFYLGGVAGRDAGVGLPSEVGARFARELDAVFPDAAKHLGKRFYRMHWPAHPHTRGSYSCYQPGQWTSIRGAEAIPCGSILFAGEHTSADWQGFMNGAAESGRVAAERILSVIGHA